MIAVQEKDIHLLDYWGVLVKRRWIIYTSLTILVVVVTLGSFLMQPVYTATTRLQIEPSSPNILPFQEVVASAPDQRGDFYQTQYGLIQSRRVAREVIANLRLETHPDFSVKAAVKEGEARRIDIFLKSLGVSPVRNSRLVDVSFSSHDPQVAARAVDEVAKTYIDFNSRAEYNTSEQATHSLERQTTSLQDEIDVKEKELQAYARDSGIVVLNEKQNISLKKLNDLNDSYTRAQAERIEKEAIYAALRDSRPEGTPEVMQSKLIQDLTAKSADLSRRYAEMSAKFKPDWPAMVRLRREMEETQARLLAERQGIYSQVLGAAESAYRAARNQEAYLSKALDETKRQSQELSLKEIQFNNLRSEIANRRATLEALVKRQGETSSSAGMNEMMARNIRIVDPAEVPARPSSPRILFNVLLSLVTGLGLGVGLAYFFEYLDKSIKTPEEMHQVTGIGSIGMIPLLRPEGGRLRVIRANGRDEQPEPRMELICHEDPKSKIAEAFRELRTALLVSQPGGPPRSILIASTQPGEGKTAVALNLAVVLAQIGRRVLLVDADLRKPRLHRLLKIANDQGLSTYLSQPGDPWPEPVKTTVPGLDLISSGPLPPNPADLLDSERFTRLEHALGELGYDHIIYDSPPVLAVADPAIMVTRMNAVLMVVQAGVTGKDALLHAVQRLQQVKGRVIGGILNQVDLDHQNYYNYGYSYKRYYAEEPREERPKSAPI